MDTIVVSTNPNQVLKFLDRLQVVISTQVSGDEVRSELGPDAAFATA